MENKQIRYLIKETELNLSKTLFRALISTTNVWDKFSVWILFITGATFSLMISNIESIKNIVSLPAIIICFFMLLGSAVFGIIAKYYSILIDILFNVTTAIENEIPIILNDFYEKRDEIDMKRALKPLINQFPKIYRLFLWKQFEKGKNDLLLNYKKAVRRMISRGEFITLQIIFFVITVFIFAINIGT